MKISEIREKSRKELEKNLFEMRSKLVRIRFDISGKQAKNHREARQTRKDIARIMTVMASEKTINSTNQ